MVAANRRPQPAAQDGIPIKGKYLIALKPGRKSVDLESHIGWVEGVHKRGLSAHQFRGVERTYSGHFQGYAGHFDADTISEIRRNPDVAMVEEDKIWELALLQPEAEEERREEGGDKSMLLHRRTLTTQTNCSWGLGAISHRQQGASDYVYNGKAGEGTYAYIVDSGIRLSHREFEGRAEFAYTAFEEEKTDTFGHGTHVAGTIGGRTFGVAKKAKLLSVKVFQGRRSATSVILAGFNWAANDIIQKRRTRSAVINMSLGGSYSNLFNLAVETAAGSGVVAIVAAGNEAVDAADVSPASAPSAVTVAALSREYTMADYSNYGRVVDIFGPGSKITSAWIGNDTDTNTISGTSMATPHVVGIALSAMSVDGVVELGDLTDWLKESATSGAIEGDLKESPNLLVNNNIDGSWN
ncbi:hypothetical protein CDD83_6934 [Cordyceps sp. RAO-2017]|nr:hypothetical protein CDD83_6934 [Cordyceps sp. RAO-2017]